MRVCVCMKSHGRFHLKHCHILSRCWPSNKSRMGCVRRGHGSFFRRSPCKTCIVCADNVANKTINCVPFSAAQSKINDGRRAGRRACGTRTHSRCAPSNQSNSIGPMAVRPSPAPPNGIDCSAHLCFAIPVRMCQCI